MSEINDYWRNLISNALHYLKDKNSKDAESVIKNARYDIEFYEHDNWNGGIDYWSIVFYLKYREYIDLGDKKSSIENEIYETLKLFHFDDRDCLSCVNIRPIIEQYIDWNAIFPLTKEYTISLIEEEKKMLLDVSTGKLLYKQNGSEDIFQNRHKEIIDLTKRIGFDYPIKEKSLEEWWWNIKTIPNYAERRKYIYDKFSHILSILQNSESEVSEVSFRQIANKTEVINKAIEDAESFIRDEKYDSAIDRIHTAFHGYLRLVLIEHNISVREDEGISSLFKNLYSFYGNCIQPPEVGERIKSILRSAGGMVNAVNELRNNNSVAHPNDHLIQVREARLVIRLIYSIIEYIEDIEKQIIE